MMLKSIEPKTVRHYRDDIIKLSELNEHNLMKYMRLFDQCTLKEKNEIFFITLKNHLMYLKKANRKLFDKQYTSIAEILNNLDSKKYIKKIKKNNNISTATKSYNRIYQILDLIRNTNETYDDDYQKSLVINFQLYENNMCPLIFYSFGKWIELKNINEKAIRQIIEFSIMSLYKVVKIDFTNSEGIELNKKGSVSNICIYHRRKHKIILKLPKTMASIHFLSEQEYAIYRKLLKTELKEFIAKDYAYNKEQKILSHEFIEGKDGEHYLFNNIELTKEQKTSLRKFYNIYASRNCTNIILDIHPGNFVWSNKRKQWIIVDLGAIPEIGSEYYNFKNFEEYYDFIWIRRKEMMTRYPIRSIDFAINLNIH